MTQTRLIPAARIIRDTPPRSGMGRMLTAAAALFAVVLATALPAKAAPDAEDYLKTIIGLAIIGAIADAANDDKPHKNDDYYYKPGPTYKPDHGKKKGKLVPASCSILIAGKKSQAVAYSESCLRRAGFERNLPYSCSNKAKIYGKWDRVFSSECLRGAGFRLEREKRN